jgi:3-oxoacyl-[acyl-carrier protein] reductase
MLLRNKNAVIYGAGGRIGSTVARVFAREGVDVFLAGRTLANLDPVVQAIISAGGKAEAAHVDALDPQAIEQHLDAIIQKAGWIDISFGSTWEARR